MKRKICVVTGARSDFGLLRPLMDEIKKSNKLELRVIVTGMHLSEKHGSTYKEVEKYYAVDVTVDTGLKSDSPLDITKSMGNGLIGIANALGILNPDVVLILGDRYEILPVAIASVMANIPLAHLHGGETTEGAIDESLRHAITKLAHIHFVAAEPYRKRVIQLGENPNHIFMVGGLGVDAITKTVFLKPHEVENIFNIKFNKKNLLITFHPITLESASSLKQMQILLHVLEGLRDTSLIFTFPNADAGSSELISLVKDFSKSRNHVFVCKSMGQQGYLSCLKHVDGVIGNSSSGILEAPTLCVPTVNIGNRQKGRICASSIINCEPTYLEIDKSIKLIFDAQFRTKLPSTISPYGDGGACHRIIEVLESIPLNQVLTKQFNNIDF